MNGNRAIDEHRRIAESEPEPELSTDPEYVKSLILEHLREKPMMQVELQGRLLNRVTYRAFQNAFVQLAMASEIVLAKGSHAYNDVWTIGQAVDLTMRLRPHDGGAE